MKQSVKWALHLALPQYNEVTRVWQDSVYCTNTWDQKQRWSEEDKDRNDEAKAFRLNFTSTVSLYLRRWTEAVTTVCISSTRHLLSNTQWGSAVLNVNALMLLLWALNDVWQSISQQVVDFFTETLKWSNQIYSRIKRGEIWQQYFHERRMCYVTHTHSLTYEQTHVLHLCLLSH